MDNGKVTFNVSGGQVNYASDNSVINVTQQNGESMDNLVEIIMEIKGNLKGLEKEDAEEIADVVDMAKEELVKERPSISRLKNCVTLIAPMVTVANGIPVLAGNLQKLLDYIMSCISLI